MTRASLSATALSFLFLVAALPACSSSSDDGEVTKPRGTVQARGACTESNDCKEPSALCVPGSNVCSEVLGTDSFTTECDAQTVSRCDGFACIVVSKNVQQKTGICSMQCENDDQCNSAANNIAVCATLGDTRGCLRSCADDGSCGSGFVCVPDPGNTQRKVCLVQPAG